MVRIHPPILIRLIYEKEYQMEYRIEDHPAFTLVGYKIKTTNKWMRGRFACPQFWRKQ